MTSLTPLLSHTPGSNTPRNSGSNTPRNPGSNTPRNSGSNTPRTPALIPLVTPALIPLVTPALKPFVRQPRLDDAFGAPAEEASFAENAHGTLTAPPSPEQQDAMRQILLAGFGDRVAR